MTKVATQSRPSSKDRSSNIELFRIVTMLFIVAHHYVMNSGILTLIKAEPLSFPSMFLLIFGAFGKTGINCFVLISGYFMCRSEITAKKFFKLLAEVYFYRIVIACIFWACGYETITASSLFKVLSPITSVSDGFTDCYLLFFLFIPFINILVAKMNELQHIKLTVLALFVYTVCGTIPMVDVTMNYISWFTVLYLIGSYPRLYGRPVFDKTKFWGITALSTFIISIASVIVMQFCRCEIGFGNAYTFLHDSNKILAVLLSVSAFMFFKNLRIKQSKFINTVASATFGVFCIHTNGSGMVRWIWQDLLRNADMYSSKLLFVHAALSVIGVFTVCTVIDLLRIKFVEKPFFKLWDKYWTKISAAFKKKESAVCEKYNIKNN